MTLVIAGGVLFWALMRFTGELDCAATARIGPDSQTVLTCAGEYRRTRLPATGVRLADAMRRTNDLDAARALANDLLVTERRADALQILGKIALTKGRLELAERFLQDARALHRDQGDHAALARDAQALAGVCKDQDRYAEALQTLDECIAEARAAADGLVEGYCELSAAQVLVSVGYFDAARREVDRAERHLSAERDVAEVWLQRGNIEMEIVRDPLQRARYETAVAAFDRSLALATRSQSSNTARRLHFKLAYSLAELGRTDEAERHLKDGALLDPDDRHHRQRAQLAALIAYRRHDLPLAFSSNEKVYPTIEDDDERIDVCVMQARIALAWNEIDLAVVWAKRGVETAEHVRAEQTLSELRPWVLASRREPFELLFTALARAGRFDEAVIVFDQWQSRTMLDGMARSIPDPSVALSSIAARTQSLGRWLPVVSRAPLMASDASAGAEMLRKIDLIAFAVAERHLWRLIVSHGRHRGDDLGPIDDFRGMIERFTAEPTDPVRARELGARLLTDDVARSTDEPLYLVLDAPLAGLPFVALRRADRPIIALRPVIRAPRLPVASSCKPRADVGGAVVLADAAGDLPEARRESNNVASLFGTLPLVGAAATSNALFAARSDPLLHVAVHADVDTGGGSLKLYDRTVLAPEISAGKLGPGLVVLSACSTATSWDPERAGSLSTAFLAAGSERVIATLRPVDDVDALELTSQFYEARGADDPVHVLARIQAKLADTQNKVWPSFAVFGKGACLPAACPKWCM